MEITCKHVICMLADCSMDTSHLRKNIFTHKQGPSSPIHHFSFPPALTIVTGSIARGQKALTFFPRLSFVCLLFSPTCSPSRALPHHFISLSPLSSLFTPQCCLHYSSSPLLSSPRSSSHYCPLCFSSGQRSWQQHSVMLTPRPPAEYSFLRKHGLTSCHFFLSS